MSKINKAASVATRQACPCGSGMPYTRCCEPFHHGLPAPTAGRLMRARYSAYVLGEHAFILASWHPRTRPATLDQDTGSRWLGLEVRREAGAGDAGDPVDPADAGDEATVEFVARYKIGGRAHRLHEISRFVREGGTWLYLDGSFPKAEKQ